MQGKGIKAMIRELCSKYTNLSEGDIVQLEHLAEMLPYFSELTDTDLFIDCFSDAGEIGVVVAQAKPSQGKSLYKGMIVGEFVLPMNEPTVFNAKRTGTVFRDLTGITQENRMVMQRVVPVKNKEGAVIGALIQEKDISDSISRTKKLEELTKTAAQLTDTLLDVTGSPTLITNNISDGVVVFNDRLKAVYINPEAHRVYRNLGCGPKVNGLPFEDLFLGNPEDIDKVKTGKLTKHEITLKGYTFIIKYRESRGNADNGIIMLINDITPIIEKEKQLIEKSAAVQEMHHRIKNSLQIITSILSLQIRRSGLEETKEVLRENINRINSIAAIHEMLMKNLIDEKISLTELLKQIQKNIKGYASSEDKTIEIEICGDDISIQGDIAIPIAIVINELVTNSIKHGFKNEDSGLIKIQITSGNLYCNVSVEDNGQGMGDLLEAGNSLGLKLVNTMVREKLKGNLITQSGPTGTRIGFDFKTS